VTAKVANSVLRIVYFTLGALARQFRAFAGTVWFTDFSRNLLEMLGPCITILTTAEVLFIFRQTLLGCTYSFENKLKFLTIEGCVPRFTVKDIENAI
jgi:hypothetical protein